MTDKIKITKDGIEKQTVEVVSNKYGKINYLNEDLQGSGGDSGSSASTGAATQPSSPRLSIEAPNTLRSVSTIKLLLAYSAGEAGGLIDTQGVDGAESIFFDRTPLWSVANSTFNFSGVTFEERFGTVSQTHVPGFDESVVVNTVNTQVTISGGPVADTVGSSNVTACRLLMSVPRLFSIDTTTGDQTGTSVSFQVHVKDPAGAWQNRGTFVITGKTTSAYQMSYRIQGPTTITAAWQLRVTRITADSSDSNLENDTFYDALDEIIEGTEDYPDVAYVAFTIDTEQFGNNIPLISLKVDGIKVRVPVNYVQSTMAAPSYTGAWNGTFKNETTPNPMWNLYDLLTNTKYGLGLDETFLDKFEFYTLAQYCDAVNTGTGAFEGVPNDGTSGARRRFTMNTQITTSEDALQLLQAISSSFRGISFYGGGTIKPVQDSPKSVVAIIGNENVQNGRFSYSSTQAKDRINVCNVTFNDQTDFYARDIASFEDATGITRYGRNEKNIVKYGCNNEAEAYSFAKWYVHTSLNEIESVSFTASTEHQDLQPGDLIEIYDKNFAGPRQSGRINGGDVNSVDLDFSVTLNGTNTYEITIVDVDGETLETRDITTGSGSVTTVAVSSPFSNVPTVNYTWAIKGTDISPRLFRVLSVDKTGLLEYDIFALFYDENKFAAVEDNIILDSSIFTRIRFDESKPVSNISFAIKAYLDAPTGPRNDLYVTWDASTEDLVTKYKVFHKKDDNQNTLISTTNLNEIVIADVTPGIHSVDILTVSLNGRESPAANGTFVVSNDGTSGLLAPTGLQVAGGGVAYKTQDIVMEWTRNVNNDNATNPLVDYKVDIYNVAGNSILRTEIVKEPRFVYTRAMAIQDRGFPLDRLVPVNVFERDTFHNLSNNASASFTNAAIGILTFTLTPNFSLYTVDMEVSIDDDFKGYIICADGTSGFTPADGNVVYKGPSPSVTIVDTTGAEVFIKIAGFDTFDDTVSGLTFSPQQSTTPFSIDPPSLNQVEFDGLKLTSNDPSTDKIAWADGTAHFSLDGTTTDYTITADNATWTTGTLWVYWDKDDVPTTLKTTTNVVDTAGQNKRVIATYKGGVDLTAVHGLATLAGEFIVAGTITSAQLITGTAVITETAQIANAIIDTAQINTAAITSALINNLAVVSAKIGNLEVGTIKIADGAVTDTTIITSPTLRSYETEGTSFGSIIVVDYGELFNLIDTNHIGSGAETEFNFTSDYLGKANMTGTDSTVAESTFIVTLKNTSAGGADGTIDLTTWSGSNNGNWSFIENIDGVGDGTFATFTTGGNKSLSLWDWDFSAIPAGATLVDLTVRIKGKALNGTGTPHITTGIHFDGSWFNSDSGPLHRRCYDWEHILTDNNAFRRAGHLVNKSLSGINAGASATLNSEHWVSSWGTRNTFIGGNISTSEHLTMDMIKDSDFGIFITADTSYTNGTYFIDAAKISVYYTTEDIIEQSFIKSSMKKGDTAEADINQANISSRITQTLTLNGTYNYNIDMVRTLNMYENITDGSVQGTSSNRVLTIREFKK